MKITEVELNNSKSGIYGLMRFYINIPNSNGEIKEKKSLCTMRGSLFNQYQNKKVKILYYAFDNTPYDIGTIEEEFKYNNIPIYSKTNLEIKKV